jgi:hypothetical protein
LDDVALITCDHRPCRFPIPTAGAFLSVRLRFKLEIAPPEWHACGRETADEKEKTLPR